MAATSKIIIFKKKKNIQKYFSKGQGNVFNYFLRVKHSSKCSFCLGQAAVASTFHSGKGKAWVWVRPSHLCPKLLGSALNTNSLSSFVSSLFSKWERLLWPLFLATLFHSILSIFHCERQRLSWERPPMKSEKSAADNARVEDNRTRKHTTSVHLKAIATDQLAFPTWVSSLRKLFTHTRSAKENRSTVTWKFLFCVFLAANRSTAGEKVLSSDAIWFEIIFIQLNLLWNKTFALFF